MTFPMFAFTLLSFGQAFVVWEHDGLDLDGRQVQLGDVYYYLIPAGEEMSPENAVSVTIVDTRTTESLPVSSPDFRRDSLDLRGVQAGDYRVLLLLENSAGTSASPVHSAVFSYSAVVSPQPSGPEIPISFEEFSATKPGNSMVSDDSLFGLIETDGVETLYAIASGTNYHSHSGEVVEGSQTFYGEFMVGTARASLGVTFLSQYPVADKYYRLRSQSGGQLRISPHGTTVRGDTDLGVTPQAGAWYSFRIEVDVDEEETRIRARSWPLTEPEPVGWQAECFDSTANRLQSGKVGVWTMRGGRRYWRRFSVQPTSVDLPPPFFPDIEPPSQPRNVSLREV